MRIFCPTPKAENGQPTVTYRDYSFSKPRNALKPHFPELRPGSHWSSLQRSPDPLAGGEGGLLPFPKNPPPLSAILAPDFIFGPRFREPPGYTPQSLTEMTPQTEIQCRLLKRQKVRVHCARDAGAGAYNAPLPCIKMQMLYHMMMHYGLY